MNILKSVLEYSAKELVQLAKVDTPNRYQRRMDMGTPKVVDAKVNYETGAAYITLRTHDHDQLVVLEDFVQLVADEIIDNLDDKVQRNDIIRLTKLAVRVIIESGDILVDCDCDDYRYRFNWLAKQYGYAAKDRIKGYNYKPDKTNPKLRGGLCKHLITVLNRISYWSDAASRKLVNDLSHNREFISMIDDKALDKKEYSEDKDYDIKGNPKDTEMDDSDSDIVDDQSDDSNSTSDGNVDDAINNHDDK